MRVQYKVPQSRRSTELVRVGDVHHGIALKEVYNCISTEESSHRIRRAVIITFASILFLLVACNFIASPNLIIGSSIEREQPIELSRRRSSIELEFVYLRNRLGRREDSPAEVCKRWSHQTAIVNGTMYVFGGRSSTRADQDSDTWNNHFLQLDLDVSWQISSPLLTGLAEPSDLPSVANGFLWNSHDSLFLYGGQFSDAPTTSPEPFALWEYDIESSEWLKHPEPMTSAGDNAEDDGELVQRASEGAGISVASIGRGWYFGGHLDGYTTVGWSQSTPRVYLKSLIEYTFPGRTNDAVSSLENGVTAGPDGVWRNITEGGLQDSAGFTERADGILVYVPGFGEKGLLLGLAGGTNATFTQMNVIDVYDIATSSWYKQATTGSAPKIRVNPCAVVAVAPDGSSYNIYMFGGQSLVPFGEQIQYDDMWILSVPSFTWIQIDQDNQSVPPARAGHTCNIWDGQMIVVGGYVGQDLSCDSPGIYTFDLSNLEWTTQYTSLSSAEGGLVQADGDKEDGKKSKNAEKDITNGKKGNPFSQHPQQRGSGQSAGLEGSYGYKVPSKVFSAIGGGPTGGATLTQPVQSATAGPLATGEPNIFTVPGSSDADNSNGDRDSSSEKGSGNGDASDSDQGKDNPNVGAIVAGTIAGILGLLVFYFAFCAFLYRKQLNLYKNHVAMTQRAALVPAGTLRADNNALIMPSSNMSSTDRRGHDDAPKLSSEGSSHYGPSTGSGNGVASTQRGRSYRGGITNGRDQRSHSRGTSPSSDDTDLLANKEPTFWGSRGVLLNPRRSLRVINRD